ncbi:hypothetical protein MTR67_030466 [Solanum verrucosum]|uniref:Uncharacterized protein n=1 Tax=Solanum verrucosum TaxID=315347 RepID=A0AAF0R7Q7_SOLVR|nr:hypothetical protein MTR67_030466 [Solanum verrucosum]
MGSDPHTQFLLGLLGISGKILRESVIDEKYITDRILALEHCKDKDTAVKTAKTIIFLGFQEPTEIPSSCKSPFEVTCLRMEEKLAYSKTEQVVLIITFYVNLLHAGLPLISLVSGHGAFTP